MALGFANAEVKITDVRCSYSITNYEGLGLGKLYVEIHGVDSGNKSVNIYYQTKEDGTMKEYTGGVKSDYLNYGNNRATLGFFINSSKTGYVDSYTRNGKCPSLFYARDPEAMPMQDYVETYNFDKTEKPHELQLNAMFLKGPDDTNWLTEAEFKSKTEYKPLTPEPGQEDKTCSYKMNFEGTHNAVDVIFKRKFNTENGKLSYSIKIDSKEMEVKDLNSDFDHNGSVSNVGAGIDNVRIKSDVLKKVFEGDKCIDAEKIYQYKDDGINYYVITLEKQDVEDNSFSDKVGDGTGTEPDNVDHSGPKTPDLDINRKHMNCKELLGTNLTAIVKAFITILQVAAAIIAIVKGMIILIPAVIAKDADSLKKQSSTLVKMAVILLLVFLLPVFVKVIGHMLDFDLSCFV